jgi:hypothetical protein
MMSGAFCNYSGAFLDFPLHNENEKTINNYQIKHLKEHQ